jgi:hypothetical protein
MHSEVGQPSNPSVVEVDESLQANLRRVPPDVANWCLRLKTIDDVPVLILWSQRRDDADPRNLRPRLAAAAQEGRQHRQRLLGRRRSREMQIEPQPATAELRGQAIGPAAQPMDRVSTSVGR